MVKCSLPVDRTRDNGEDSSQEPRRDRRRPRVLVVDDEPAILETLARAFGKIDAEVLTAPDTDGALSILGREKVDVVVTDWLMPGGGGERLIEELLGTVPPVPPVILLTGSAAQVNDLSWKGWSAITSMLEKPFMINELIVEVRRALGRGDGHGDSDRDGDG